MKLSMLDCKIYLAFENSSQMAKYGFTSIILTFFAICKAFPKAMHIHMFNNLTHFWKCFAKYKNVKIIEANYFQ